MAYIELADLRSYLDIDGTDDDPQLQGAIKAAERVIDNETKRHFEAATATRYYSRAALDNDDSTLLHLDLDCLTVTTLLNGDSAATPILVANYWLLNRNLGPPYHWIQLKRNTGIYWEWDTDYWVSVTGTWGYMAQPDDAIKRATKILAAYFYRAKDAQMFETTAILESGAIAIPQGLPATLYRIIDYYRRYL